MSNFFKFFKNVNSRQVFVITGYVNYYRSCFYFIVNEGSDKGIHLGRPANPVQADFFFDRGRALCVTNFQFGN